MVLQLIATQTGLHTSVPQPNDVQLITSPGWELMIELFSEISATDSSDSNMLWGRLIADQFDLLDGIQKDAILNVVSQVAFSDSAAKDFVKILSDTITMTDMPVRELTKYVMDQFSLSDSLWSYQFTPMEFASTLTLIDSVQLVFASYSGSGGRSNIYHGSQGINRVRQEDTSTADVRARTESDISKYSEMESDPKVYTGEDSQNI